MQQNLGVLCEGGQASRSTGRLKIHHFRRKSVPGESNPGSPQALRVRPNAPAWGPGPGTRAPPCPAQCEQELSSNPGHRVTLRRPRPRASVSWSRDPEAGGLAGGAGRWPSGAARGRTSGLLPQALRLCRWPAARHPATPGAAPASNSAPA